MADLVTFARLEVESGDLEPWAALLRGMRQKFQQDDETALWLIKLYNAFDSISSAFLMFNRWGHPRVWDRALDKAEARMYPHMKERRNLYGGRGLLRFQSYADLLRGGAQRDWLWKVIRLDDPHNNFLRLMQHLQTVWGVGRLAAFEWAEFLGKVMGWPIHAPDGQLWLSSGPRKSLQRLYGDEDPSRTALTEYAMHCREHLANNGVDLEWEDFETVICDFNVMRGGRYYPGRHLAALRGEIDELTLGQSNLLLDVFREVIPEPWNRIAPGIDKALMPVYANTGQIVTPRLT